MKRNIIRKSVEKLQAYDPEPQEALAVLNANENPYNLPKDIRDLIAKKLDELDYNRYPDPNSTELKGTISEITSVPEDQIIVGNGLDEILSIITNTFIDPNDVVVTHSPGFSMYKVWTDIANGNLIEVEDIDDHKININGLVNQAIRNNAKLVIICSPNNPTGQVIRLNELRELLETTNSLIVLDEAYGDFENESFIDFVNKYDNLLVLKTLSKAYRMPAARCGYACGPKDLIQAMNKVKAPYNLNALTQEVAKIVLENRDELEPAIDEIISQRKKLYEFLDSIDRIKVFPSKANFLYFKTPKHRELNEAFLDKGILVRYYPKDSAFRLTIGTPKENIAVKETIKEVFNA